MLGGAAVGGVAGVAAGAALGGLKLLGDLPGMLKGLRDASGQAEGGPFDRIIASAEKFQQIGTQLLATVFSPLAPAFELAAQYAGQFFDRIQPIAAALGGRLGGVVMTLVDVGGALFDTYLKGLEAWWPLIDKVAQAFEAAVFVVGELAVGALDLIGQLYDWLGGLIGKAVDFGTQGKSGSQLFFDGLKLVAQGAGWVWDAFKYGAGIVAEAAGKIIGALKEVAKASDAIMGTDWARRLETAGADLKRWGADARAEFGQSAAKFGAEIDKLQAKFDARSKLIAESKHEKGDGPKPFTAADVKMAGAMQKGSTEAYSLLARERVGQLFAEQNRSGFANVDMADAGNDPVKVAKEQLKEAREMKRILYKWVNTTSFNGTVVRVIP